MNDFIAKSSLSKSEASNNKKAKDIFSETIKMLFSDKIRFEELTDATHKASVSRLLNEVDMNKALLNKTVVENLKLMAEVNLSNATTEAEKAWAKLVRSAVNNINFKNMPPTLQYSIIQAIATKGAAATNPILEEEINKFIKQQREAEAGKALHEMRKVGAEADVAEATAKKTKHQIEDYLK